MNTQNKFSAALQSVGGLLAHRRKPRYVYLCAFFFPVLLIALLWAIHGVAPFGSRMILAHDQWHQYYPFYLDLRRRILSGESLFHSWTTGMGTSYLPLFAYYLASPLNYVAALLPESAAMLYYTLTVLVRIGLAGLFCAYFLKKTFDRSELMISVFSSMYALCAFLMGYYWNAIWLDTVALLPLVVLGTFSLLRDRRCVLYTFCLFLSVFCSYYIGLFVCIFVLLIFIGWHIVNWDSLGGFFSRFLRIAFFTLLALGMTAVLTIPAFLGLQSTSSAVNKFPEATAMNMVTKQDIPAEEAMELLSGEETAKLWAFFNADAPTFAEDKTVTAGWSGFGAGFQALKHGSVGSFLKTLRIPLEGIGIVLGNTGTLTEPTTMEGLPNIFCGFSTLLLAVLYLLCRRIPLRERLYTVFLLLFFGCSFLFRTLDYLWHGMHFPNMLPYRFSFLWSFTVIFMAYRAWSELDCVGRWRFVLLGIPTVLLVWCVASHQDAPYAVLATVIVAAVTLAALILFGFRLIRKEHLALALGLCMLLEAAGCAILGVNKVGVTDSAYYPTQGESTRAVIEQMKERERDTVDLWRAEVAMKQSLNDGTLLGYPGVTVFSSAANAKVSQFAQSLGLAASVAGNRYAYQESDPFTNLLLGLKYLIDRNGRNVDSTYFRQVAQDGQVVLLENQAYLPMGILVQDAALNYDPEEISGLPYERLNRLFRLMTGTEDTLFTSLPLTDVQVLGEAETTYKTASTFGARAENPDEENCVEVSIRMPSDGHLCYYSKSTNSSDLVWYLNGERQYTYSDKYGYNRYMGYFRRGDLISIRYRPQDGKTASVTMGAALFQGEVFDRARAELAKSTMMTTMVSDTRIEGAIRVREAGLVYTSIPNDDGWSLTVDNEPARITPVGNAMIAFHLEPGIHTVELSFTAPGFSLGLKISLICLAAFVVVVLLALLARFTRPPIVKMSMHLANPQAEQLPEPDPAIPPVVPSEPDSAAPGAPGFDGTTMPPLDMTQPPIQIRRENPVSSDRPASTAASPDVEQNGPVTDRPPAAPLPEARRRPSSGAPEETAVPRKPIRNTPPAPDSVADAPTGVFDPVLEKGDTAQWKPSGNGAEPDPAQRRDPPEEVYSREELDRLLRGDASQE